MPYIYQADLYCDSCGEDIRKRLDEEGKTPENLNDEHTYDSDNYPKYVYEIGESDSPSHCGSHADCLEAETLPSRDKIGALLSTDLTTDGVLYVREAIEEGGEVAEFWNREFESAGYDFDMIDEDE